MNKIDEIIGWYGTAAIVMAYILLSFNVMQAGIVYQLMNVTGAIGIFYISFKKKAWQPGVLNLIWALIALVALISILIL